MDREFHQASLSVYIIAYLILASLTFSMLVMLVMLHGDVLIARVVIAFVAIISSLLIFLIIWIIHYFLLCIDKKKHEPVL